TRLVLPRLHEIVRDRARRQREERHLPLLRTPPRLPVRRCLRLRRRLSLPLARTAVTLPLRFARPELRLERLVQRQRDPVLLPDVVQPREHLPLPVRRRRLRRIRVRNARRDLVTDPAERPHAAP